MISVQYVIIISTLSLCVLYKPLSFIIINSVDEGVKEYEKQTELKLF